MTVPLLSATGVTMRFGRVAAVRDAALSIAPGESIGIVGESGSGKSTLARILAGLQPPSEGDVRFRGEQVYAGATAYPGPLRRQVQMVFQDPYGSLNPRMTALAAVAEACRFHERCSAAEADDRSLALLARMGIGAADARKKPRLLSGGQRQRASVARALAATPALLIADEPTSAIDQSAQAQLLNLFHGLLGEGLSIILISHDLAVVRYLARRVHVMCDGAIVETGDTATVFDDPQHAYTRALIASIPGRRTKDRTP